MHCNGIFNVSYPVEQAQVLAVPMARGSSLQNGTHGLAGETPAQRNVCFTETRT
jgi:hypothetical protein